MQHDVQHDVLHQQGGWRVGGIAASHLSFALQATIASASRRCEFLRKPTHTIDMSKEIWHDACKAAVNGPLKDQATAFGAVVVSDCSPTSRGRPCMTARVARIFVAEL